MVGKHDVHVAIDPHSLVRTGELPERVEERSLDLRVETISTVPSGFTCSVGRSCDTTRL